MLPAEVDWIDRLQHGDLEAFNALILLYQDSLYTLAVHILQDEDRAADALQEAFLAAFRSLHTFHGGSFRSWLARAVINKCYDECRRSARHPILPLMRHSQEEELDEADRLRDPTPSPEEVLNARELNAAIQDCLRTLPVNYRTVLILVDVDGLSYEEAATILRLPIGTVKSRLPRARLAMRRALQRYRHLLPHAFHLPQYIPT